MISSRRPSNVRNLGRPWKHGIAGSNREAHVAISSKRYADETIILIHNNAWNFIKISLICVYWLVIMTNIFSITITIYFSQFNYNSFTSHIIQFQSEIPKSKKYLYYLLVTFGFSLPCYVFIWGTPQSFVGGCSIEESPNPNIVWAGKVKVKHSSWPRPHSWAACWMQSAKHRKYEIRIA